MHSHLYFPFLEKCKASDANNVQAGQAVQNLIAFKIVTINAHSLESVAKTKK
jgi:hypothetical protein